MIRLGKVSIDQAWHYTASGLYHQDETSTINDSVAGDTQVFSSTCVNVGDIFYFGHSYNRFGRISGSISTISAACPVTTWEYYNRIQSAWVTVPELDSTFDWKTAGSQDWVVSASKYGLWRDNWGKTSVCGISAYYIRARVSSVSDGGSGATFTSASVDLTLPDPIPSIRLEHHGKLHQMMNGSRVIDINATKHRLRLQWLSLDIDDANSVRERVKLTTSTCVNFDSSWGEDTEQMTMITDLSSLNDAYAPPSQHNITLELLET